MKYLSSALMILLFCIPCHAMQHDKPNPLSLQFMLNTPEPEDDQANHNNLAVLPVNNNMPQDDNHLIRKRPARSRRPYRHKEVDEDGNVVGYSCQYCPRIFAIHNARINHERTYHQAGALGKAKVKCPHCEYTCLYQSTLTLHLATHLDDSPYKCYCSQACNSLQALAIHRDSCSQYQAILKLMAAAALMQSNNNREGKS